MPWVLWHERIITHLFSKLKLRPEYQKENQTGNQDRIVIEFRDYASFLRVQSYLFKNFPIYRTSVNVGFDLCE